MHPLFFFDDFFFIFFNFRPMEKAPKDERWEGVPKAMRRWAEEVAKFISGAKNEESPMEAFMMAKWKGVEKRFTFHPSGAADGEAVAITRDGILLFMKDEIAWDQIEWGWRGCS